jgi:hypothetical protein
MRIQISKVLWLNFYAEAASPIFNGWNKTGISVVLQIIDLFHVDNV